MVQRNYELDFSKYLSLYHARLGHCRTDFYISKKRKLGNNNLLTLKVPNLYTKLFFAHRHRKLDEKSKLYSKVTDPLQIANIQLLRFNRVWQNALISIPFYKYWQSLHSLPSEIKTLDELANFPVLTKNMIASNVELIEQTPNIERYTLTGGTSGVSAAFPMNQADANTAWVNTHLGRRWNGIEPGDKLFLIWGHSHLFGGRGAIVKQIKRLLKDRIVNVRRVSAYRLTSADIDNWIVQIRSYRPKYIIGYGSCLVQLSRRLEVLGETLTQTGIGRIVNTSEPLLESDARKVAIIFGCPVINEYGMAETGVLGYSIGALFPISVFWDDYIISDIDERILVTTIGDRCLPLINYDTEDLNEKFNTQNRVHIQLEQLSGKARDIFEIINLQHHVIKVSVVLFDHIFKQLTQIKTLHYELLEHYKVRIHYTSEGGPVEESLLFQQLEKGMKLEGVEIDQTLFEFLWLQNPKQTLAGKRQSIIR